MKKYRILDTFCKAGGAGMGYYRAGFEVVGVDIEPQPHYPFEFRRADALEYIAEHGAEFDAIHASPPCQFATKATLVWRGDKYAPSKIVRKYHNLIPATREAIKQTGKPYVIENVPGAANWLSNPLVLNGGYFGLNVHRVRLFECSFPVRFVLLPAMPAPVKMGRPVREGEIIQPVGHFSNVEYARRQMGIDWMTQGELAQAIPPAYTEFIGRQLLSYLEVL